MSVARQYLVEVAGQGGGVHHLLAGAFGVIVDDAHHRRDACLERAGGAIALKLVVLDEIDTRIEQPRHLCGSRLGIAPDARLDDRAARSEERRVGKGGVSTCRSWWAPYH